MNFLLTRLPFSESPAKIAGLRAPHANFMKTASHFRLWTSGFGIFLAFAICDWGFIRNAVAASPSAPSAFSPSGQASHPAHDYPVKPVPFTSVHLTDIFWAPRIETNRLVTIPFAFEQCERSGRMDNFIRAAIAL